MFTVLLCSPAWAAGGQGWGQPPLGVLTPNSPGAARDEAGRAGSGTLPPVLPAQPPSGDVLGFFFFLFFPPLLFSSSVNLQRPEDVENQGFPFSSQTNFPPRSDTGGPGHRGSPPPPAARVTGVPVSVPVRGLPEGDGERTGLFTPAPSAPGRTPPPGNESESVAAAWPRGSPASPTPPASRAAPGRGDHTAGGGCGPRHPRPTHREARLETSGAARRGRRTGKRRSPPRPGPPPPGRPPPPCRDWRLGAGGSPRPRCRPLPPALRGGAGGGQPCRWSWPPGSGRGGGDSSGSLAKREPAAPVRRRGAGEAALPLRGAPVSGTRAGPPRRGSSQRRSPPAEAAGNGARSPAWAPHHDRAETAQRPRG